MQCQKESLENDTRQYITFNTHYVNNRKTFHEILKMFSIKHTIEALGLFEYYGNDMASA